MGSRTAPSELPLVSLSKKHWVKGETQGHSVFQNLYRVRPYVTTVIKH